MKDWKRQFIEFAISRKLIQFGNFILKSGRKSPYFFNSGLISNGNDLAKLGYFYAQALIESKIEFDVLFGLAYKGIPIVISMAIAMSKHYKIKVPYCFNRKEIKDHGERGLLIGSPLYGKVMVVDDVITTGISIYKSIDIINIYNAHLTGILISLDRQETKFNDYKHVIKINNRYKINSIITLSDLIEYLKNKPNMSGNLKSIYSYQDIYGI
ncbi:orotate phosphoribosyltransferase [Pantoea sp. SoEX]|uniref:orotate phosphoribosyltransferase n=1 Tax=Pantoea sp. SoEX TaxID=2576763 RepID=UPI001356C09E|nr:orotate phosphoribosyltransferase [Pantoea sp. SoEX]MXP51398.1 orotate phosphoribosyltransferase [Pantoea sp. SoEX]